MTTTIVGIGFAAGYDPRLAPVDPRSGLLGITSSLVLAGLGYSVPLLLILLAHELGHYLTCRHYGLDASPPFFLPLILPIQPFIVMPGTFGAVIRIREPIRDKRALFDMAVAGPIAGFAVALPFACYGILHTRLNFEPVSPGSVLFGYPLVVKGLQILLTGHTFTSVHVLEHPTFFAAWFGFLVTALNLIPAGQLDGGHTLFAVSPVAHRALRWPLVAVLAAAGWFLFPAWGLWAVIVIVMSRFGRAQLRDAGSPLGPRRVALAVLVLVIFVISLVPVPYRFGTDLAPFRSPREGGGTVVHQLDLHRGPEAPGRHGDSRGSKDRKVAFEERLRLVGARSPLEAGPPPA